jgi:hypothetical protein
MTCVDDVLVVVLVDKWVLEIDTNNGNILRRHNLMGIDGCDSIKVLEWPTTILM